MAIEAPIDTPPGNYRAGYIEANHTISLRTPVRLIREGKTILPMLEWCLSMGFMGSHKERGHIERIAGRQRQL